MSDDWHDKLRERFAENMKQASLAAGLGETAVRDIVTRRRPDPSVSSIVKLARKHHISLDWLFGLGANPKPPTASLGVLGYVAAGVWLEVDPIAETPLTRIDLPADPGLPEDAIFGLIVRGTSINKIAQDGDILICVDVARAGIDLREGDLVIVERQRDQQGLREVTAKRVRRGEGGRYELWPESDDPLWQSPITLDEEPEPGEECVQAIARVEGVWRPVHNRG